MARHVSDDDRTTSVALMRYLGAAVALVLVVAAAFAGIGAVQDDGADPVIAGTIDEQDTGQPADTGAGVATPDTGATSPPDQTGSEPTDGQREPPADDTGEDPAPTTETATEPEPDADATDTATDDTATDDTGADGGQQFDPASISVQVLDAYPDDGGTKTSELAQQLRADGYNVVATNKAYRRYEQTTVMFTPGFEAQARQIAQQYGFSEVREQPGNLSEQVQVHLVVGADA